MLKTPVTFIIFNRPEPTKKVFESIRQVKPKTLFVISDGPREGNHDDFNRCKLVREIIDSIDWNCEVVKNYSEQNLGCGKRVSTGISWVFDQVESSIFLEDDCLPDLSFFDYCEELLEIYKNDTRIMSIGGTNILGDWKSNIQSYHFSYYGSIWGWASWRRAWKHYDYQMKSWSLSEVREAFKNVLVDQNQIKNREEIFSKMAALGAQEDSLCTWDYQWLFSRLVQSGLSILPNKNLVSNIGFDKDATHTKSCVEGVSGLETFEITFPLKHPPCVTVDRMYDQRHYEKVFRKKGALKRISERLYAFIIRKIFK